MLELLILTEPFLTSNEALVVSSTAPLNLTSSFLVAIALTDLVTNCFDKSPRENIVFRVDKLYSPNFLFFIVWFLKVI
jgi:hypothetical protein